MKSAIDRIKKMTSKITIRSALLIICAAVFAVSAYMLISYYAQGAQEEQEFRKLADVVAVQQPSLSHSAGTPPTEAETPLSEMSVVSAYQQLHEQNPDMVGWVKIEGTAINYPVMYTPNDGDFYLNHGFDKQKSKSGVPFIDQRCSINPPATNIIIYGHHMKNGTMFADLAKYKDKKFWQDHPVVRF
jgi:sortase B